jgi:hypothetical protein
MTNATQTITQPTQAELNIQMYGFSDIDAYIASVKESITYKFTGASMVVAGLLSDAQELLTHGDEERSRQTLNIAKAVLFEIVDGNLVLTVERK